MHNINPSLIKCLVIGLLVYAIAWGQARSSWDNTALDGAGMPPMAYQVSPFFGKQQLFPKAFNLMEKYIQDNHPNNWGEKTYKETCKCGTMKKHYYEAKNNVES